MSDINGITVTLIRELNEFMVCNGSINKGIKGVYGFVTVVHLRHTLVRRIWTAWIFLYSSSFISHCGAHVGLLLNFNGAKTPTLWCCSNCNNIIPDLLIM